MTTSNLSHENTPSFSIALVNYKTLEMTKICLDLLHQHFAGTGVQVWVIDNYSNDASTEYLRSLDWIHLIERPSPGKELGQIAHGKALDLALHSVNTDYLFIMHTDTFIFDKSIFKMMLDKAVKDPQMLAAGCLEQLNRGTFRTVWRHSTRRVKHYSRRLRRYLGFSARNPKPHKEVYLKSFFAMWNCKLIKEQGMQFTMDEESNPGYAMQDRASGLGYTIECLSPRKTFSYLDHIQSGTVAAAGGYEATHRRTLMYKDILQRLNDHQASRHKTHSYQ